MIKIRLIGLIVCMLSVLSIHFFGQEKIQKKVDVIHKEIHLRITKEGKSVSGLKKDDFILFINNRERVIQGFNEYKRKIKMDPVSGGEQGADNSRLFVLLFNVADYHLDMKKALDYLFQNLLKPKDRIMVITNNFSISDRFVEDLAKMKKRIEELLKVETRRNRQARMFMENALKDFKISLIQQIDINDPNSRVSEIFTTYNFIEQSFVLYKNLLRENRTTYLNIAEKGYVKLSEYLKGQRLDKFIISFYQLGTFPRLRPRSKINKLLDNLYNYWISNPDPEKLGSTYASQLQALRNELNFDLEMIGKTNESDVGKHFANAGATMFTMLLSYKGLSNLEEDFDWGTVSTDTENVLREMSKMSGGTVETTTNAKKFLDQVSEAEDVYYILTYMPEPGDGQTPPVFIRVDDPGVKVLYDNQKRTDYFKEMVTQETGQPSHISIESFYFEKRVLSFDIAKFKRVMREGKLLGRFDLRIRVFGKKSESLFDRQKKLVSPGDVMPMKIRFNQLKRGKYDLVVEVKDLLTNRNDLVFKTINVRREKSP